MIKISVVEDEKEYVGVLEGYIKRYAAEKGISVQTEFFSDGLNFNEEYKGDSDVVFMDIAMPHVNGLQAAKRLREKDKRAALIFITTLAKYAIRGYEVDALDFLIKPVEYELFAVKLERALAAVHRETDAYYGIVTPTAVRRVKVSDIVYIESDKHYLLFHIGAETVRMRGTIKEVKDFFLERGFAAASNSMLVSLAKVDAFSGGEITVCGCVLPVARAYRADFFVKLAAHIGRGS